MPDMGQADRTLRGTIKQRPKTLTARLIAAREMGYPHLIEVPDHKWPALLERADQILKEQAK